jgi:hypothetical protein
VPWNEFAGETIGARQSSTSHIARAASPIVIGALAAQLTIWFSKCSSAARMAEIWSST